MNPPGFATYRLPGLDFDGLFLFFSIFVTIRGVPHLEEVGKFFPNKSTRWPSA